MKKQPPAGLWRRLLRVSETLCGLCEASAAATRRSLVRWFRPYRGTCRRKPPAVVLQVEPLEIRWVMSTVAFSSTSYSVSETAGNATVTVTLDTAPPTNAFLSYSTSDGTALAGTDYTATSGSLTFTPSGALSQSFNVPITDEGITSGSKNLNLGLSVYFGATLGSPSTATLTINAAATSPGPSTAATSSPPTPSTARPCRSTPTPPSCRAPATCA